MPNVADYPFAVTFVLSLGVFLAASEIGHRCAGRGAMETSVSTLEGAMLGLVALLMGFTFSMALTRFDARRDAVLGEANAIGTAALRARFLPEPQATKSIKLLREYLQIELDLVPSAAPTPLAAAVGRSNEIQRNLWDEMERTATGNHEMVLVRLYIQSLNDVFANRRRRLVAFHNRVPSIVFLSLYAVSTTAMAFVGYASFVKQGRWRVPVYGMGLLLAGVILLIQDVDRPAGGFIFNNQDPLIDTANAIDSYPITPGNGQGPDHP